tara:strand:- start:281 stop:397 length:117 start_codon:yes stop_codon:yes gene_type:complete
MAIPLLVDTPGVMRDEARGATETASRRHDARALPRIQN